MVSLFTPKPIEIQVNYEGQVSQQVNQQVNQFSHSFNSLSIQENGGQRTALKSTAPTTKSFLPQLISNQKTVKQALYSRLSENGQLRDHAMPLLAAPEDAPVSFDAEDAFYVCDLGEIVRQYAKFKSLMPRVEPFYAIKCHPDPMVLQTLVSMGAGFDCASRGEIDQVMSLGVDPQHIIYANPCKPPAQIRYAHSVGVRCMTFDNADELIKIQRLHPNAQLVLRILADDSKSVCRFGVKFGASLAVAENLLKIAKELDLDIIGVSFHVGSGCFDASAFADAVASAKIVMDQAKALGFNASFLDLGGGFPGSGMGVGSSSSGITFEEIAMVLNKALDQHFPVESGVRIIAEPGRYFVSSAYTLACNITSRRVVPRKLNALKPPILKLRSPTPDSESISDDATVVGSEKVDNRPGFMYYINDGVYGSMNCIYFDHVNPVPKVLASQGVFLYDSPLQDPSFTCSVWGPTCDSMDCVVKEMLLPELDVGDWFYFEDMGAYTRAAASEFNGFKRSDVVYTNTEPDLLKSLIEA